MYGTLEAECTNHIYARESDLCMGPLKQSTNHIYARESDLCMGPLSSLIIHVSITGQSAQMWPKMPSSSFLTALQDVNPGA